MQVFLETERLLLRRLTEADVDNLVELDSDPEVMLYITGGVPTPREVIESDHLPAFMSYYKESDRYGFWAAIEKASGDFIGWFHFRPPHGSTDPDEAELGYRLRKAAWGRGYATEGSRALITKGFSELGVQRVVASAYEDNIASRRVMEKAGMKLVRVFRMEPEDFGFEVNDDFFDGEDVEYAIARHDWERQRGSLGAGGQSASTG